MIQRIQSIFLFLGAMAILIFTFSDFVWQSSSASEQIIITTLSQTSFKDRVLISNSSTIYLMLLGLATAILFLVTLFLYKNRSLQLTLSKITAFALIILVLVTLLLVYAARGTIEGAQEQTHFSVFALALALLFNRLASRFIKKDIALVESSERLR